jgi:4-hydroxyacetophenone monooxygenase
MSTSEPKATGINPVVLNGVGRGTAMVEKNQELLTASDETIDEAVRHADPMVLRGILYQLTGDESIRDTPTFEMLMASKIVTVTDEDTLALLRAKAATFLKALRDAGPGEVSIGPESRLQTTLSLTAGENFPAAELEMWVEALALDPWARGLKWPEPPPPERVQAFNVAVIGAGMGGLNAAVHLRRAGIPFFMLEMGGGVGGTWYWNRYPGARVDSPSRTYTHMFAVDYLQPSEHCPQEENEKYFNWVADTFDLRPHIEFDTEVKSLVWDEETSEWVITAEQADGTRTFRANAVISAVGIFSRLNIPTFPGQEDFKGCWAHTARWPEDLDLIGKRVAVVGSGCSGYQMMPEIAPATSHLYLFQRTPSWVLGAPRYLSWLQPEVAWLDRNLPFHPNFVRFRTAWFTRADSVKARFTVDPDYHDDPDALSAANKRIRDDNIRFMRSKFAERPDLMEKMLPLVPPGSSRPVSVDQDNSVYDALLRDDVTLVTEPIERITETGIVVEGGTEHPVDVIVLATGFKSNDYLWPMEVRGRDGLRIEELWEKDGARAYLGTMVAGFPNFFMVYGPNTNPVSGMQVVDFEENVTRFALRCIASLILEDKRAIDVTTDGYWRFNAEQDRADALRIYNYDKRVQNYYTSKFGRSITNSALDVRLLWSWLRDPIGDPRQTGEPTIDERLAQSSPELAEIARAVDPYIGKDLIAT